MSSQPYSFYYFNLQSHLFCDLKLSSSLPVFTPKAGLGAWCPPLVQGVYKGRREFEFVFVDG